MRSLRFRGFKVVGEPKEKIRIYYGNIKYHKNYC